jgi:hypothetical protein
VLLVLSIRQLVPKDDIQRIFLIPNTRKDQFGLDGNLAASRGELACVGGEVVHNLLEPSFVSRDYAIDVWIVEDVFSDRFPRLTQGFVGESPRKLDSGGLRIRDDAKVRCDSDLIDVGIKVCLELQPLRIRVQAKGIKQRPHNMVERIRLQHKYQSPATFQRDTMQTHLGRRLEFATIQPIAI